MLRYLNQWSFFRRQEGESAPLPNAACPIAHLVGPGRLRVDNDRLLFEAGWDEGPPTQQVVLDPDALEHLCCYGRVQLTTEAMHLLLAKKVNVALLSFSGRDFLGRLTSEHGQKPYDRIVQSWILADARRRLEIARDFVSAKIRSEIGAARHYQRHGHGSAAQCLNKLKSLLEQVPTAGSADQLRGIEGLAASAWFDLLAKLLRKPFAFPRRSRRPPTDPVNALLSLGYSLVTERAAARLTALGFEVALGALHEFRPGRPSLACDHVEPLRVQSVDRWVVQILNEGRLKPDDFETPNPQYGVRIVAKAFPSVLASWETNWREARISDILDRQILEFRNKLSELRPSLPTLLRRLEAGEGWADE